MNPLIQLKKATPLFVITLVLACFALSPQAFAQTVAKPTFSPPNYSGCKRWKDVTICSPTPGARIYVWWGAAGGDMSNCRTINVGPLGTIFLQAYAHIGSTKSGIQSGTYTHHCSLKVVFWVIGGILLAAVLITILHGAATGRISVRDADADAPKL